MALNILNVQVIDTPEKTEIKSAVLLEFITTVRTSGRTEHHRKLHMLISAEIRKHKLAGHTLLLA